ncbi:MAG: hypothetical protein QW520_02620 [Methanomassiliicoccales archaeon]
MERRFRDTADASSPTAKGLKENTLAGMLGQKRDEKKFLLRSLSGGMRNGASESMLIEALALAWGALGDEIGAARMRRGDLAELCQEPMKLAKSVLAKNSMVRILTPLRPMLADVCSSLVEAIILLKGTILEFKWDDARLQIHRIGQEIRVFSGKLMDRTSCVTEIVDLTRELPSDHELIVEGGIFA